MVQLARCTNQVVAELNFSGGNRRPRRITGPVARAQGRNHKVMTTNRRTQACCIPSERITRTVWVASTRPKPSQMDAIHTQRCWCCNRSWLVSMVTIVVQWHLRLCRNAVNQRRYAVNGLSPDSVRSAFCLHAHLSQDHAFAGGFSVLGRARCRGSSIYQRRRASASGALSGMGLPHVGLRYELQPSHADGGPSYV